MKVNVGGKGYPPSTHTRLCASAQFSRSIPFVLKDSGALVTESPFRPPSTPFYFSIIYIYSPHSLEGKNTIHKEFLIWGVYGTIYHTQ